MAHCRPLEILKCLARPGLARLCHPACGAGRFRGTAPLGGRRRAAAPRLCHAPARRRARFHRSTAQARRSARTGGGDGRPGCKSIHPQNPGDPRSRIACLPSRLIRKAACRSWKGPLRKNSSQQGWRTFLAESHQSGRDHARAESRKPECGPALHAGARRPAAAAENRKTRSPRRTQLSGFSTSISTKSSPCGGPFRGLASNTAS